MDPSRIAELLSEEIGPNNLGLVEAMDPEEISQRARELQARMAKRTEIMRRKMSRYEGVMPETVRYDGDQYGFVVDILCPVCNEIKTYAVSDVVTLGGFPAPPSDEDEVEGFLPDTDRWRGEIRFRLYGCHTCRREQYKADNGPWRRPGNLQQESLKLPEPEPVDPDEYVRFMEKRRKKKRNLEKRLSRFKSVIPGTVRYMHGNFWADIICPVCKKRQTYSTADIYFFKGFEGAKQPDSSKDYLKDEDEWADTKKAGCYDCIRKAVEAREKLFKRRGRRRRR